MSQYDKTEKNRRSFGEWCKTANLALVSFTITTMIAACIGIIVGIIALMIHYFSDFMWWALAGTAVFCVAWFFIALLVDEERP